MKPEFVAPGTETTHPLIQERPLPPPSPDVEVTVHSDDDIACLNPCTLNDRPEVVHLGLDGVEVADSD